MRKRVLQRRKTRHGLDPVTWSLFTALLLSLFFARISSVWGFTTPRDCYEFDINFVGPTAATDGPFEWFFVIGLAGVGALLAQAINAIVTRSTSRLFWGLWAINFLLAGVLLWACALVWAWFNPTAPAAKPIFQITRTIQPPPPFMQPETIDDVRTEYHDWVWDETAQHWVNEGIGLIEKEEIVAVCKRAGMKRAQLKLLYGERMPDGTLIDELDTDDLEQPQSAPVLYDLEGNYLTTLADGWREEMSAITRSRDAAYDPAKAAMSPEEARRRWLHHNYWYGFDPSWPPRAEFPRISKDEIDQIVAESWGDKRPSWHED